MKKNIELNNLLQNKDSKKEKLKKYFHKIRFIKDEETFFSQKAIILFLVFYIIIPMLVSFTFFISNAITNRNDGLKSFNSIFNFIFSAISIIILSKDNNKKFWHEGFWILIFLPFFNFLSSSLNSINLEIINNKEMGRFFSEITLGNVLNLIFSLSITISVAFFYFKQNRKEEVYNFKNCFKKNKFLTTFVIIGVFFIAVFLINLFFSFIKEIFNYNLYQTNQNLLEEILKKGNIFEFITTIFSILFIASIFEELIYRKAVAEVTNNKWWIVLISSTFFAFLHIQQANDWENIFLYFGLGIVNGTVYFYFRNSTLIIMNHFVWNLFALIMVFVI